MRTVRRKWSVTFQPASESTELEQVQPEQATQPVTVTQTRSGRISKPPDHLVESDD